MKIGFVGGPLDKKMQDVESAPDRIWADDDAGKPFLYEAKNMLYEGAAGLEMLETVRVYAPVSMSANDAAARHRALGWPGAD
jgi:hypothetical protein